ncbi:CBS domain-containing protein [Hyalangium rubrum]|uniref:CBS domain-containing protein n=1 Tax=Hyalangium rubrum TaxID=3103134 RepID=A0ABU5H5Q0_9BACT|nr:CBS domain-containing protein [Hyalangium sp. s54d21]MDY7228586.1 CBS domain-containing protein [Hyalangium sp. s54d21]
MLTVDELMTREVITLEADAALAQVDDLLKRHHIRHLPVVQGRKLVGLVSHRDLIRALARQSAQKKMQPFSVKEVMTREVETVEPHVSAREAIDRLLENRFGCLPVVDEGGHLLGIVTESDFLRLARRLLEERERRWAGLEPPASSGY